MSAPSSSRMLVVIREAMNSSVSAGTGLWSRSALLRRMARRVSRSGGWMSVIRPHLNRPRSRSSSVGMASGMRSLRDDDLLVGAVQRVERVEELLLEPLLALHELDVVDEQHVDVAVAALEVGDGVGADGVDVLVEERLGGDVAHDVVLVVVVHVVADGVQQVGLAQTGRAVDEQRVVRLRPGVSATRSAAARANWLDAPLTNASNVYRGFMPDASLSRWRARPAASCRSALGRRGAVPSAAVPANAVGRARRSTVSTVCTSTTSCRLRGADLLERIAHQRQVAGQDAVAGVAVRGADAQHGRSLSSGDDVLEGGEPDRFGDLRTEDLSDRCPHLLVRRSPAPPSLQRPSVSTPLSTPCGQRNPAARDGTLPASAGTLAGRRDLRAPPTSAGSGVCRGRVADTGAPP